MVDGFSVDGFVAGEVVLQKKTKNSLKLTKVVPF